MKTPMTIITSIIAAVGMSGCASMLVPEPGKITLEDALASVGRGLVTMKQEQIKVNAGKEFVTGLVPSEAEVTFNVHAAGKQDGKLYVELSPIPTSPTSVAGTAGANVGTHYSASRGNQITIRFRSLLFGKKTTTPEGVVILEGVTDPKVLDEVIKILKEHNITVFVQ
jgi:hypothetical protein